MSNYFTIPDTGQIVYSGDVVMLSEYPNMKWITRYGWYPYNSTQTKGWYFSSIPDGSIVPASQVDLSLITVISSSYRPGPGPCPPGPCPPGPFPPGPGPSPSPFTPKDAEMLSRSALTVDSIAQRNALDDGSLPDGKIVRVNSDSKGKVSYYEWDTATMSWISLDLGSEIITSIDDFSPDMIVTTDEIPEEGDDSSLPTTGRMKASIDEAIPRWIEFDEDED